MLGEVLTAIVTPFRADGSVDLEAFRALCGFLARQRLGRARRHRHHGRGADAVRRGAARAVRGRGRRRRRPRDGRRGHGHVLDGALDPPHRAGARDRRRRLPRRHAVLQQAAAARHRRPRRGDRGGHRPAGRLLRHPGRVVVDAEPATISRARGDRERPGREAGEADASRRRATSSRSGLDLYAGDDDLILPFLEVGGVGGHLRPHAHRRPAGEGADRALSARATSREPARSTRSSAPRSTSSACRRTRSPIKRALNLLGHEVGGLGCRSSRPTEEETARSATASSGSASSAHLRSDPSVGGFAVELRP